MKRPTAAMAERLLVAVLAAGLATRFGGGKLDARCAGKPLGQWALDAVADAGLLSGIIITNPAPPLFATQAKDWRICINPEPERGLSSSLALVGTHALAHGFETALVLLGDMPLVTPEHLQDLCHVAPSATDYGHNRPGVPALLTRDLLEACAALEGDRGAGPLLSAHKNLHLVPADTAMLLDVDRPEDLALAESYLLEKPSP
ncbi:NTP transferase domain-containing protein [Altererythrobacter indicus]|uniref:NTP transferase domain-containing protein n=1 Tax=Altericroceibacterium indicum TaxID=374177 RepID=A0A845AC60_9SPHN|nr:nucleotidyltransferase family protein [Altericroceibacterium indicum]MXP26136.1 NTP transferase domain-containing protein [Altericroceibacterium indicum]